VQRYVRKWLGLAGKKRVRAGAARPYAPPPPSPRQLSFGWVRRPEDRRPNEQRRINAIRASSDELATALGLADEFADLIRKRSFETLSDWLVGSGNRSGKQDAIGCFPQLEGTRSVSGQNIWVESDGSNIIQVVYTLQPMLYGNLISQVRSGTMSFYLFDGLGSTAQLANSIGSVTDSYLHDSWSGGSPMHHWHHFPYSPKIRE
jgi:hypothetical protein